MPSYKGVGPKKQFWPTRMKLSKPFHRQLFHYAENFLHELLSNIHRINCPTPVGRTKIIFLKRCVISLAQYRYSNSDKQNHLKFVFFLDQRYINYAIIVIAVKL